MCFVLKTTYVLEQHKVLPESVLTYVLFLGAIEDSPWNLKQLKNLWKFKAEGKLLSKVNSVVIQMNYGRQEIIAPLLRDR